MQTALCQALRAPVASSEWGGRPAPLQAAAAAVPACADARAMRSRRPAAPAAPAEAQTRSNAGKAGPRPAPPLAAAAVGAGSSARRLWQPGVPHGRLMPRRRPPCRRLPAPRSRGPHPPPCPAGRTVVVCRAQQQNLAAKAAAAGVSIPALLAAHPALALVSVGAGVGRAGRAVCSAALAALQAAASRCAGQSHNNPARHGRGGRGAPGRVLWQFESAGGASSWLAHLQRSPALRRKRGCRPACTPARLRLRAQLAQMPRMAASSHLSLQGLEADPCPSLATPPCAPGRRPPGGRGHRQDLRHQRPCCVLGHRHCVHRRVGRVLRVHPVRRRCSGACIASCAALLFRGVFPTWLRWCCSPGVKPAHNS